VTYDRRTRDVIYVGRSADAQQRLEWWQEPGNRYADRSRLESTRKTKRRDATQAEAWLAAHRASSSTDEGINEIERRKPIVTLGFVGLGHMGGNMAARFLAAGYSVYGESRDRRHAGDLVHKGLQWSTTPYEVAEAADVLITSLPDDDALEAVASGPDGILAGLTPSKIWIDMSTVSPRKSRDLADRVRAVGAELLDAPVSGSVPRCGRER
jgi:hypothetical protein